MVKAPLKLPLAAALVVRGEADLSGRRYLTELGRALDAYRSGQFEKAAQKLESLAARYPKAVEPVFYLGVTRLLLDQTAGSVGSPWMMTLSGT